jgi:hypothetical protein
MSAAFATSATSGKSADQTAQLSEPLAKEEDHLEVDAPIPGQQFVCLSFVSPEKVMVQKEAYFRTAFWAYLKASYDSIDFSLASDFEDIYANFLDVGGEALEEKFHKEHAYQTTVRGLKVRGTYSSQHEADIRARVLQKLDRGHHVFVAPVGYWLPWDPSEDAIADQVYQEEQLNELMKNYKQNESKRDTFYEEQKGERKKEAVEENGRRREAAKKEQDAEKKLAAAVAAGGDDGESDITLLGASSGTDEKKNEKTKGGKKKKNKKTGAKNATSATSDASQLFEAVETQAEHLNLKTDFDKFKQQ